MVLGNIEGGRRSGQQRLRWLDSIADSMSLSKLWECEGQGSLVCCSPWGHKESDMTEQLKNNNSVSLQSFFMHISNIFLILPLLLKRKHTVYSVFTLFFFKN